MKSFTEFMLESKKLTKTDIDILINSATGKHYRTLNTVHASSLDNKRQFNSLEKLQKMGMIDGNVSYESQSGETDGRHWKNSKSWNEFSGELTKKGIELALSLVDKQEQ